MKTTSAILFALFLTACSAADRDELRPVPSEPEAAEPAAAARVDATPVASVEFPEAPADGPHVEVVAKLPMLLDGELLPAGSRKLVAIPDGKSFETLIDGMEFHLPAGTTTLTITAEGWEIDGSTRFAYPPEQCEPVQGGVGHATASNLVVNFGISCGTRADIGKFAVSACGESLETFHRGTFSGGPLFALTQYGRTEMFVVPPGEQWEVLYAEDRWTFAVH